MKILKIFANKKYIYMYVLYMVYILRQSFKARKLIIPQLNAFCYYMVLYVVVIVFGFHGKQRNNFEQTNQEQ